ncbi:hypothetical protein F5I97DRAFT_954535 [Phlebopus sp. FC_14]|nr:hypothetical protein F5I97DRAFT_954535 [Phlebopus sp. FC_14]
MVESMTSGWSFSPSASFPYASSSQFSMELGSDAPTPSLDSFTSSHHFSVIGAANFGKVHLDNKPHQSPRFPLPDLPSWTALKTSEDNDDDGCSVHSFHSDHEHSAAAMSTLHTSNTEFHRDTATAPVKDSAVDVSVSKSSSHTNVKKARFDGVLIVSRLPRRRKHSSAVVVSSQPPTAAESRFSLVDALQRTFDANRHPEGAATAHLINKKDVSAAPQTDAESGTEPEDESGYLRPNTLLAPARSPGKRRLTRNSASALFTGKSSASASTSDGATPVPQPASVRGRQTKPISYGGNAALVDAALGTRLAHIKWDAIPKLDIPEEAVGDVDATEDGGEGGLVMTVEKANRSGVLSTVRGRPMLAVPRRATPSGAWTPYQSRHSKFRQRLNLLFGDDATVRVDKGARPRAPFSSLATPDVFSRASSPCPSTSSAASFVSASGTSSTTEPTSQSPESRNPPSPPNVSSKRQLSQDLNESGPATKILKIEIDEQRMNEWNLAVQRLVKGKVRVTEETLEGLSSILAEIESIKDHLGTHKTTVCCGPIHHFIPPLTTLHRPPSCSRTSDSFRNFKKYPLVT